MNEYVYCTKCKHFRLEHKDHLPDPTLNVNENEMTEEKWKEWDEWTDGLVPTCIHEKECGIEDCEDARPGTERPFYEAKDPEPELGNLLFGHSYGQYSVSPREEMEMVFGKFLDRFGCDMYGILPYTDEKPVLPPNTREISTGFGNDVFEIHPYYWGSDKELENVANFIYRPLNLELRWYKYPLRDSWSNIELSVESLKEICDKCLKSVYGKE